MPFHAERLVHTGHDTGVAHFGLASRLPTSRNCTSGILLYTCTQGIKLQIVESNHFSPPYGGGELEYPNSSSQRDFKDAHHISLICYMVLYTGTHFGNSPSRSRTARATVISACRRRSAIACSSVSRSFCSRSISLWI